MPSADTAADEEAVPADVYVRPLSLNAFKMTATELKLMAAAAMSLSSVSVIGNALRLRRMRL